MAEFPSLGVDHTPKDPLLRWLGMNLSRLAIYLGLASFAAAAFAVLADDTGLDTLPGLTVLYFVYGGLLGVPGMTVWLLSVASLPPECSTHLRRAVAIAINPVIQVFWLVWLLSWGYHLVALVFGLLLPAGSAFVVRLRERRPSSRRPAEGA